jgi:hypothetical protein
MISTEVGLAHRTTGGTLPEMPPNDITDRQRWHSVSTDIAVT